MQSRRGRPTRSHMVPSPSPYIIPTERGRAHPLQEIHDEREHSLPPATPSPTHTLSLIHRSKPWYLHIWTQMDYCALYVLPTTLRGAQRTTTAPPNGNFGDDLYKTASFTEALLASFQMISFLSYNRCRLETPLETGVRCSIFIGFFSSASSKYVLWCMFAVMILLRSSQLFNYDIFFKVQYGTCGTFLMFPTDGERWEKEWA